MNDTLKSCVIAIACLAATNLAAQTYPSKSIRFIVPVPPGGANDTLTRAVAPALGSALGRQVVVDNRPGGNTTAGTDQLAKSAPDGYTLLMAPSAHTVNASLYKSLPYDPIRDFEPVALVAQTPLLLSVHPSLPVRSVKDLVTLARSKPGELNYASAGNGTSGHLAAELFNGVAKVRITHIPYKGGTPAVVDLLGGHVQVMFPTLQTAMAYVPTGKLRVLATSGAKRSALAKEIPTMGEQGYPAVEIASWYGVLAPAGTPKDIVARLNEEIRRCMESVEMRERLTTLGYENFYSSADQFAAYLKADLVRWAKVVKDANIKADQ